MAGVVSTKPCAGVIIRPQPLFSKAVGVDKVEGEGEVQEESREPEGQKLDLVQILCLQCSFILCLQCSFIPVEIRHQRCKVGVRVLICLPG